MLEVTKEKKELTVIDDDKSCFTYAPDLALAQPVAGRRQQCRHEEHRGAGEAGLQQAVALQHEHEGGGAQEGGGDE